MANANADAVSIENKYKDRLELAKAIGQEKANTLTDAEINEVNKRIEKAQEEINTNGAPIMNIELGLRTAVREDIYDYFTQ